MTTLALCLVTRLPETVPLRLLRGRERLGHFQHGMMVLFVRELTRNLPSLTKIELYRDQIRLNDAKAAHLGTASSYLGFTLCEQSPPDTSPPVLVKHPKVIHPLLVRYYHPENLCIRCCYPCQRPVLVFELQGDRIRSEKVLKRLSRYYLYKTSHGVVLVGLRSTDNHLYWHAPILNLTLVACFEVAPGKRWRKRRNRKSRVLVRSLSDDAKDRCLASAGTGEGVLPLR